MRGSKRVGKKFPEVSVYRVSSFILKNFSREKNYEDFHTIQGKIIDMLPSEKEIGICRKVVDFIFVKELH